MDAPTQESRVIPWGTKLTASERAIVLAVAKEDNTTAAELIRSLALPIIRARYERIRQDQSSDMEPAA